MLHDPLYWGTQGCVKQKSHWCRTLPLPPPKISPSRHMSKPLRQRNWHDSLSHHSGPFNISHMANKSTLTNTTDRTKCPSINYQNLLIIGTAMPRQPITSKELVWFLVKPLFWAVQHQQKICPYWHHPHPSLLTSTAQPTHTDAQQITFSVSNVSEQLLWKAMSIPFDKNVPFSSAISTNLLQTLHFYTHNIPPWPQIPITISLPNRIAQNSSVWGGVRSRDFNFILLKN